MITIAKSGNTVTFTFDDNSHYLYDGKIEVPVNSLSLVIDSSDMATFKKSATNDIFFSATYSELGMTKDELIAFYKNNMVDTITEDEIDGMITSATSGYADYVEYDPNSKYVNFYHGGSGGTVVFSYDASAFVIDGMIDSVEIKDVVISGETVTCLVISFNTDSGKQDINIPLSDIFDPSQYYTKSETSGATEIATALSAKTDNTAFTAHTADTVAHTTQAEKTAWNGKQDALTAGSGISISANVISSKTVELTQAEYDALVSGGTVDPTTWYIITDAQPINLNNYYTKSETSGATEISTALSGKQNTLTAGSGISISGDVISADGGGGKAVSGGTNISITTGETADTINCTLPITIPISRNTSIKIGNENQYINANYSVAEGSGGGIGDTSSCSHKEGLNCIIGNYAIASHVEGNNCEILYNSSYSHAEGNYTKTANVSEHASGQYNVSNKANNTFGDSGNTLFSIGNGTYSARHNAFEIRQNGDIYCSDGTNDVKLQDTITATTANTTALGGLSLVKLTQVQYDALSPNYDNNVLYVVTNS